MLTDGEENRLLFRSGLLGNACRRLFQGVAHLGIPADGVRLLAVDGVEDLDGVFARVQVDIDLLAAGVAPAAGARDRRLIGALPIDLDLRIFGRGGGGLLKADGQDVLPRLVHRLVEGDGTAVCAQAGHVAGAVAAAPVDHSGVPLQNGVLRLELFALRRARLCDRDVVHIRRLCIAGVADIGPHIDHMAIVILQVFDAPLRKGLGVQFLMSRCAGHILAGEVAAGAVYAYLERVLRVERVNLLDEIRAAREAREVKLHPAVFVAHIGLPAVVQIEIHVSVIVQIGVYQGFGRIHRLFFVDFLAEEVPGRPSHLRGQLPCGGFLLCLQGFLFVSGAFRCFARRLCLLGGRYGKDLLQDA